jgi:hypothetical protein
MVVAKRWSLTAGKRQHPQRRKPWQVVVVW